MSQAALDRRTASTAPVPNSENLDIFGRPDDVVVKIEADATHADPADIWKSDVASQRTDIGLRGD